ncbi:hypothetical protein [Borrelia duttonii]|uniref:hypothetical protein n=1 Tax=Borrelia duttonii TaxID=40834 RepID=UPI00059B11E9
MTYEVYSKNVNLHSLLTENTKNLRIVLINKANHLYNNLVKNIKDFILNLNKGRNLLAKRKVNLTNYNNVLLDKSKLASGIMITNFNDDGIKLFIKKFL